MAVPVVLLLALDLRQRLQPFDHLVVLEVLQLLEAQQHLVGRESIPMYLLGVVEELPLSLLGVPLVAHPDGDGDGEGEGVAGLQIGRADENSAVVLVEVAVVEADAGLEAHDLLGVAKGEGEGSGEPQQGRTALQFDHSLI